MWMFTWSFTDVFIAEIFGRCFQVALDKANRMTLTSYVDFDRIVTMPDVYTPVQTNVDVAMPPIGFLLDSRARDQVLFQFLKYQIFLLQLPECFLSVTWNSAVGGMFCAVFRSCCGPGQQIRSVLSLLE